MIESGRETLNVDSFSLEKVVQEQYDLFKSAAKAKGINLYVNIDPNLSGFYLGDALKVGQVISNLLGNAVKFTEQGEVRIETKVTENNKDRHRVELSIKDTGIGIEEDQLEAIFKEFHQAKSAGSSKEGFGLGLAIVKHMVQALGGTLELDSREGVGTTVRVGLPRAAQ